MTKEELEKEAEEYADWFWGAAPSMMKALARAYIKGAEPREKRIAELEKENAELRAKESFVGDQNRKLCEQQLKIEVLEAENAELKAENDARKFAMVMSEKVEKQLREENTKLKKQLEMSNKVYNDNHDYSHHIEEQFTKAKELIERLLITSCNSDVLNLLPNLSEVLRIRVEAEQFIKDSEVEK